MGKVWAHVRMRIHCLFGMFRGCQPQGLRDEDTCETLMLACRCGRLFWEFDGRHREVKVLPLDVRQKINAAFKARVFDVSG